jgi:DNA-binding MarR family transcriptional regulator
MSRLASFRLGSSAGQLLDGHPLHVCHEFMSHGSMQQWSPRIAEVSRRLRSRADAILGAVWFMPQNGLPSLAARVASLGRVPGAVAAALFAPQHPGAVAAAVDDAWRHHEPATLLETRLTRATAYLARAIGDEPPGIERAVPILRRVVEAGSTAGHALYAGLRALPWPGTPLGDLWRACDMIRERRGGSHLNAWTAAGLNSVEIQLLTERWRTTTNPGSTTADQMGYSPDEISDALNRFRSRGLVDRAGDLTDQGREFREGIERATDVQEAGLVEALGDDVDEVFDLMAPWARAVVAAAGRIG